MTTLPQPNPEPVAIDPQLARYGRMNWQAISLPDAPQISRESNWWLVIPLAAVIVLMSCSVEQYTPSPAGPDAQAHQLVAREAATRVSSLLADAKAAMPDNETPLVRSNVGEAQIVVAQIPPALDKSAADIGRLQKDDAIKTAQLVALQSKYDADEMLWVGPRSWRWFRGLSILMIGLIVLAGIIVGGAAIATGGVLPAGSLATCFIVFGHAISLGVHALGLFIGKIFTGIVAEFANLEKDAAGFLQKRTSAPAPAAVGS